MKKLIIILLCFVGVVGASARDEAADKVTAEIGADIVSQYMWRGQHLGDAAIQPTLGVAYKGLSLSAWGSTALTDPSDTKEFDLTLAYQLGGFNLGVTDYWFNTPNDKYFDYCSRSTSHVFEANVGYDFGVASLQWFTNFAGNDGVSPSGKRAYSSYVEATVPFALGGLEWSGAVGAVPYATSFYSDAKGFAVVNVSVMASKNIKITDSFSLPLWAKIVANPSDRKAAFVVGLTIKP